MIEIGLISDTHGWLREEVVPALAGVDCIIHAGDIGKPLVIAGLQAIAPVYAVRGNIDQAPWSEAYPEQLLLSLGGRRIRVLHDIKQYHMSTDDEVDIVVSGHSHRPSIEYHNNVLYLNPGSAGPKRFRLPVSLARLSITQDSISPRLIELTAS